MYSEVVKREKRWKFFMLVGGVPICAGAISRSGGMTSTDGATIRRFG